MVECFHFRKVASTTATVLHFARPTRGYPEGRIRILCDDGTDTWWDVSKLAPEWITALQDPAAPPVLLTPTRGRRSSSANTPGTTGRGRSRRASSSRAGDGHDSSGAGAFSDGEGAPLTGRLSGKLLSPAPGSLTVTTVATGAEAGAAAAVDDAEPVSPTTGVRQRTSRPRKSLRFAPGTVSPGAHAVAPTVAAASAVGSPTEERVAMTSDPLPSLQTPALHPTASEANATKKPGFSSVPPRLSWEQRFRNSLLIFLVMLPSIYFYRYLHFGCREDQYMRPLAAVWPGGDLAPLTTSDFWCAVGYQEPLLAVNLVFLLNVGVLFWFISLLQLIDPFWTIVPVMIGLFYQHHPAASSQPLRSRLAMGLLWIWAVRLTHSYFRREEWQVGAREDWRYARMAQRLGPLRWAVVSFFVVGITQQLMLVGITLPLLAIHTSSAPWSPLADSAIFLAAATGIMIALVADNQLRDFMVDNEKRAAEGRPLLLLLDTGLWRYSRHPNFFGEQLWWWSLGMWAVLCGQPWMLVGAAFNTLCFIPITRMTEARMLERPERTSVYRHYQLTTSVWLPWPKRAAVS
ncbi:hypothetical protein PLESTB_000383300 [Pleodorina starrii]|uniref:Steroid 5-alpha reductase C-terminal domain-containing protein n=1 Tax=Pleodorina starrii TaxID=330485 RepID=A0A9W6EZN5_9CHLO|nr:hypothetical protein PLESTB_000383300 [Pleodorina starrii]GLC73289.1 hypothetical protein PLESTF_001356800 [Pleodorina starrii]